MRYDDGLSQTHHCRFHGDDQWSAVKISFQPDVLEGLPISHTDPIWCSQLVAQSFASECKNVPSIDGVVTVMVDVSGHGEFVVLLGTDLELLASGRPTALFATHSKVMN